MGDSDALRKALRCAEEWPFTLLRLAVMASMDNRRKFSSVLESLIQEHQLHSPVIQGSADSLTSVANQLGTNQSVGGRDFLSAADAANGITSQFIAILWSAIIKLSDAEYRRSATSFDPYLTTDPKYWEACRASMDNFPLLQDIKTITNLNVAVSRERVELSRLRNWPVDGADDATNQKAKPLGRPRKDQPRATVNARMIDEMGRNPPSKDWTIRQWAECLKCSKSAIEKTASWKMIVRSREAEKKSRKTRTPKQFDD